MNDQHKVLDHGFVRLLDLMPQENCDQAIVNAARVSRLEITKGEQADKALLRYLFLNGHTSPFEQVQFKFMVKAPIFVVRQWFRHRTWSYNEQSRRYSDDEVDFYLPNLWREQGKENKQSSNGSISAASEAKVVSNLYYQGITSSASFARGNINAILLDFCVNGEKIYRELLGAGVAKELARIFLPINMYTTFVGSVNAHNLMHFLRLRLHHHAQFEIREYAGAIFSNFFKPHLPWTAELFEESLERTKDESQITARDEQQ